MMKSTSQELIEVENELQELETRRAALLKRKEALSPAMILAEHLHSTYCHANHIDGCGWEYDTNWQRGDRASWLRQAGDIINLANSYAAPGCGFPPERLVEFFVEATQIKRTYK